MLKTLGVQLRASMPVPSKGEVLSPEKIRATTGGVAFLPHPFRFSGTSVNNPSIVGSASHCNRSSPLHKGAKGDSALPTLPNPHYPSKIATFLPYERSVGFASLRNSGRSTSGIHARPLSKVRCCRPKKFGRLPEGLPHHHSLLSAPTRSTILKSDTRGQKGKVYNKRIPTACFGNGDSVLYIGFTLSIYPHRQQAQRFRVRDYPSSQAYIRRPKFRLFHRCRQASAYSRYRLSCRLRSACRYLYGR